MHVIFSLQELKSLYGHSSVVTSVCFVGSSRLCSAANDESLSLWDAVDGHR